MYGALFSSNLSHVENSTDVSQAGAQGAKGVVESQSSRGNQAREASSTGGNSSQSSVDSCSKPTLFQPRPMRQASSNTVPSLQNESNALAPQNGAVNSVDAEAIWQAARSQLAMQMPAATYDTWMRDTKVVAYEDGEFIIGIPNAYVRDWLENRLRNKIKKTLSALLGRSVQINFRVVPPMTDIEPERAFAPLYEQPSENGSALARDRGQLRARSGDGQASPGAVDQNGAVPNLPKTVREDKSLDDDYLYEQESSASGLPNVDDHFGSYPANGHVGDGGQGASDWRGTMHSPGMLNPAHTFNNFVVDWFLI